MAQPLNLTSKVPQMTLAFENKAGNGGHPFQLSTEEIEGKLIEAGIAPTSQRILICQFVLCKADHPTADEVFAWATQNLPKISLATVYNTLEALENAGLIRSYRFSFSDKVIYDCNTEDHHHFYDDSTQKLMDVPHEAVQIIAQKDSQALQKKNGLKLHVTSTEVLLRGSIESNSTSPNKPLKRRK